ncbi:bifunctional chorismate mutase/prephenate dehydrogenase [Scytonema millei]|uniref:Bifunctional chorismate mutase/prephenate dehydrogenase n=1 Tax=Scytonema millei VB511283 TaxID=1245923 RepID=A0A9X5E8V0_9CYAN|nr:bifunctional chorismate mutase/prephenate dehydrogenase [Scytonema millei]NHC37314.1 bifunctional chorismate mutase/prephenate dehydrogenase [Scytonema millei VB511283]
MTNFNRSRKITIIGGRGRMGKFFTQQLSTTGHQVSSLGNQDWDRASQLLGEAELVIISVPIERTVAVIERAAKYLSPTTALADITSIKTQPVQAMLANHAGAVMGLHPMFGPSVKSFAGQKVVVCSGRNDEVFQWLLDCISDRGGELISCTPEEHDRIMVTIQATRHFSRFCCGAFLSAENIDLDRSLLMSTPSYRQEIEIINRLFAQNPALCVDIMLATEERCEAIARLAQTYSRLAELIVKKDRSSLIREFEIAQSFLTQENLASTKQKEYAMPSEVRATITVTQ